MPAHESFTTQPLMSEQNLGSIDTVAELNRVRMEQLRSHMPAGVQDVFEQAAAALEPTARAAQSETVGTLLDSLGQQKTSQHHQAQEQVNKAIDTDVEVRTARYVDVPDYILRQRYEVDIASGIADAFGRTTGRTPALNPGQRDIIRGGWNGVAEAAQAAKKAVLREEKTKWKNRASEVLDAVAGDSSIDPNIKAQVTEMTLGKADADISVVIGEIERLVQDHRTRKAGSFLTRIGTGSGRSGVMNENEQVIRARLNRIVDETSDVRLQIRLENSLREMGVEARIDPRKAALQVRNQIMAEMSASDPKDIQAVIISKTDEYVRGLLGTHTAEQGDTSNARANNEGPARLKSPLEREIDAMRASGMSDKAIKTHFAQAAMNGGDAATEELKRANALLRPRGSQEFRNS